MDVIQYAGLWILLAQVLNMWAWLSVIQSGSGLLAKAIWTVILLVLPGIGYILWYLFGPRQARV